MVDHALVIPQFVSLFRRLCAFFGLILLVLILLVFTFRDMPTP